MKFLIAMFYSIFTFLISSFGSAIMFLAIGKVAVAKTKNKERMFSSLHLTFKLRLKSLLHVFQRLAHAFFQVLADL